MSTVYHHVKLRIVFCFFKTKLFCEVSFENTSQFARIAHVLPMVLMVRCVQVSHLVMPQELLLPERNPKAKQGTQRKDGACLGAPTMLRNPHCWPLLHGSWHSNAQPFAEMKRWMQRCNWKISKKKWSVVSVEKRLVKSQKWGSKLMKSSPNCRPKPLWGQLRSQLSNLSCGVSRPAGRQRCWREHRLRPAETAGAGSQTQVFFGHCDNIKDIKGGQKTPMKPPEKKLGQITSRPLRWIELNKNMSTSLAWPWFCRVRWKTMVALVTVFPVPGSFHYKLIRYTTSHSHHIDAWRSLNEAEGIRQCFAHRIDLRKPSGHGTQKLTSRLWKNMAGTCSSLPVTTAAFATTRCVALQNKFPINKPRLSSWSKHFFNGMASKKKHRQKRQKTTLPANGSTVAGLEP